MSDNEKLITQIKQAVHEVSEEMLFQGSDYLVKAVPYTLFLEALAVFEKAHNQERTWNEDWGAGGDKLTDVPPVVWADQPAERWWNSEEQRWIYPE